MTKAEIIEAAFKVWGRDFYLNTSLSQVAKELGVCKPALYRHFRNKDALLEAMVRHFFDAFSDFVRTDYEKALKTTDSSEGIFILIRTFIEFYARNVNLFIFSMVRIHNRKLDKLDKADELGSRGVNMMQFHEKIKKDYLFQPLIMRLINATMVFFMARFHQQTKSLINTPDEAALSQIIDIISKITETGFCFNKEEIDSLDYDGLEKRIAGTAHNLEDDPLLKAVAGAVAEAGPWETSMEQVARRSGLSKSSLYGHYKSKLDMLYQLFRTEYVRMNDFAQHGMTQSTVPLEQLYLGIFSIVEYLRAKPDILVAMDWIRNRKLDGKEVENMPSSPPEFLRLFENIEINSLRSRISPFDNIPQDKDLWISPWLLFLIINTLMQTRTGQIAENIPNGDIRFLYRFITLGIGGFKV